PEPDRRRALDVGLASGDARVRRRALELVLARDGAEEVARVAADDDWPAVRRWVEQLLGGGGSEAAQPTLFG
ncbi:MAG: hypothetical protein M3N52_06550, partial [Actinomycetota bacterium]|nr:hypothetical protein [Actinomycetota bacterium]